MNKQFKKLAEQAGYEIDMFGFGHWDMPECKKFAELIVQECANKIGENFAGAIGSHASAHNTAVKQCQQTILEHFGVELDDQSS